MATLSTLIAPPDEIGPLIEPITLQQAKTHLRVFLADDDEYIEGLITAARMMLESRLNRVIAHTAVEEVVDGFVGGMALSFVPYLDGLQVEYVDTNGDTQTFDGPFYLDARKEPARLFPISGSVWPSTRSGIGAVTLRYHAGYASGTVPATLVHWMKLAIGTMYDHRATMVVGASVALIDEEFMKWLWQPYMVYA